MTLRDRADTDPEGPPILEECPTEVDLLPLGAQADEAWTPESLRFTSWPVRPPEAELTGDQLKKELAVHDRIMFGLGLSRVNGRRRKELVEARDSGGRDFAVYSGVGSPSARTTLVESSEAPTVLLKRRRRMPWHSGVVVACIAMAAVGAFGAARRSSPSTMPAGSGARAVASETTVAEVRPAARVERDGVESEPAKGSTTSVSNPSSAPVASASRWVEPRPTRLPRAPAVPIPPSRSDLRRTYVLER